MKIRMILTFLLIAAFQTSAFCGVPKTGGSYEFMSDVIENAGIAPVSGGNYSMYNSIGQPSGYEIVSANTYTMVGGFLGVVDETPPTIQFVNPQAASNQSGTVGVIGTAFDENGTQWTIHCGPGSSPAVWKQLGSGTANVTGASLASWNASALSGTYTLKIVAVDDRGNTATGTVVFNVGNVATITGTIPKFKWMVISTPIQPSPSAPISMFGSSGEYKVFRWDTQAQSDSDLSQYRYPESLKAGDGVWIKSYYNDLPYSYSGPVSDSSQDYVMPVSSGWNQIGTPFNRNYPWGQIKVKDGGTTYDLTTAANLGLISTTINSYDYMNKSWVQNDIATQMPPETGYMLKAYKDLNLVFPPGAGTTNGMMRIVRQNYDYRVKISATTKNAADTDNFIGSTSSAAAEYDAFDAEEPPKTMESKYVTLYFPRQAWTRNAGRYATDIRTSAKNTGTAEDWTFNVETNDSGEMVTLTWDNTGLPTDKYSFTLINIDTGDRINMAAQNSYSFVASGGDVSTAHLKIEVVKLTSATVTKKYTLKPGWNLISVPLETEVTSALAQLGDDLPMLDVFQYFDGSFYPAEKADIQAGFGYWIYVSANTEIDLVGTTIPADQTVDVPLKHGWNLIGNPYDAAISWNDGVTLKCGASEYTLSQAAAAGAVRSSLYEYTESGYKAASALEPWRGYFIYSAQDCAMSLTGNAGN